MGLARLARQRDAHDAWAELISRARAITNEEDYYGRACLESIAGNIDEALELLRLAIDNGANVDWAREDPNFLFIRDDPRYRALVGLE